MNKILLIITISLLYLGMFWIYPFYLLNTLKDRAKLIGLVHLIISGACGLAVLIAYLITKL